MHTFTSTSFTPFTTTIADDARDDAKDQRSSSSAIAGGVIGGTVLVALLGKCISSMTKTNTHHMI